MHSVLGIDFNETEVMLALAAFNMLPQETDPDPNSISLRDKSTRLRQKIQEFADAHAS